MDLKECKTIYDAAVAAEACKGNVEAAKRYLDAGDTEGFERVCRGNVDWLKYNGVHYVLSDGIAENWYDNGVLHSHHTYVNGKVEGLIEVWYDNGILSRQINYKDDKPDGLCTVWYDNGDTQMRYSYFKGKLCGLYERWNKDGSLAVTRTYINGIIQNKLWFQVNKDSIPINLKHI